MKKILIILTVIFSTLFTSSLCGCKESQDTSSAKSAELKQAAPSEPPSTSPVKLDLYVSSFCKFGIRTELALLKIQDLFKDKVKLDVRFIEQFVDGGKLNSMFGAEGLAEDLKQTCIKKYYSDKFFEYLKVIGAAEKKLTFEEIANNLKIDAERINNCVSSGEGESILKISAGQLEKLNIQKSPTLFINEKRYEGAITSFTIYNEVYKIIFGKPAESIPDIVSDLDGQNAPDEGCGEDGKPKNGAGGIATAKDITHYVIKNNSQFTEMERIVNSTKKMFPNINIQYVEYDSPQGKQMIERYKIKFIPAYLFSENVRDHESFAKIRNFADKTFDTYMIRYDVARSSIALEQKEIPGKMEILMASYSDKANAFLKKFYTEVPNLDKMNVAFHYVIVKDLKGNFITYRGKSELEEDVRRLIIGKYYPDKFIRYLAEKVRDFATTYWEDAVIAAGIDPKEVRKRVKEKKNVDKMLEEEAEWLVKRNLDGDFVFYINNNEAVYFSDDEKVKKFIEYLTNKK